MFVAERELDHPHASVIFYDDPIHMRGEIAAAVKQRFLVRTRADEKLQRNVQRRDAALVEWRQLHQQRLRRPEPQLDRAEPQHRGALQSALRLGRLQRTRIVGRQAPCPRRSQDTRERGGPGHAVRLAFDGHVERSCVGRPNVGRRRRWA